MSEGSDNFFVAEVGATAAHAGLPMVASSVMLAPVGATINRWALPVEIRR